MYFFIGFILACAFIAINLVFFKKVVTKVFNGIPTDKESVNFMNLVIAIVTGVLVLLGWPIIIYVNILLLFILYIMYKL